MENFSMTRQASNTEKAIDACDFAMLMFTSKTCNNCRYIEEIMMDFKKIGVPIFFLYLGKEEYMFKKYSIEATPTVVVLKDKEIIGHIAGEDHRQKYVHYLRYFNR